MTLLAIYILTTKTAINLGLSNAVFLSTCEGHSKSGVWKKLEKMDTRHF